MPRDKDIIQRPLDEVRSSVRLAERDRLTVVMAIHYEHRGDQPLAIDPRARTDWLDTGIEPYQRRLTATKEWQPIDLGWVEPKDVGMVVIHNLVGMDDAFQPSAEELEDRRQRVLELSFRPELGDDEVLQVMPGAAQPLEPKHPELLNIRCRHGTCNYRIYVLPK